MQRRRRHRDWSYRTNLRPWRCEFLDYAAGTPRGALLFQRAPQILNDALGGRIGPVKLARN